MKGLVDIRIKLLSKISVKLLLFKKILKRVFISIVAILFGNNDNSLMQIL